MTDTDAKTTTLYLDMLRRKSPQERLAMAFSMYDFAKRLVVDSLRDRNLSPDEMRKEIFLRFYGNDFRPEEQRAILRHLSLPA